MYLLLFLHILFITLAVMLSIILAMAIVKVVWLLFNFLLGVVIGAYYGMRGKG